MQIASLKHLHIPVSFYFRSICPDCRRGQKITPQQGMRHVHVWKIGSNGNREVRLSLATPRQLPHEPPGAKTYFTKEENVKYTISALYKEQLA